ncbi:MAG: polysaccharide biosynthesis protein [Naasia sp.]|nr:polysaccharide biosynthesis protein [Naasia sp.]
MTTAEERAQRAGTRSTAKAVGAPAVMKVGVMVLSGILGILTSRLIISHYGTEAYAQYGLLTALPNLLPFADLGISAVIINTIAGSSDPRNDLKVRRTIVTAWRALLISSAVIASVAILITALGAWPLLLGNGLLPESGSITALVCLLVFAAALPITVGQRILVGMQRNTIQVAAQAIVAPFMILSVGACILLSAPAGGFLAIFSFLGSALVSLTCLTIGARLIYPQVGKAMREVPRVKSAPGVPIMNVAWPMMVQFLALPIAMQTDRLLLSHLTTGEELAQYNLASQLFGIVLQTVSTAGLALWPIYAKARAKGQVRSPVQPTLWFLGLGLAAGLALAVVSPWLVEFVSDGQLHLDGWLVGGFVAFVALQAAKYPVGMYMTDERGLKFQVIPILILVPLNLGLSWYLIPIIGAGGPIIGSAISTLLCQLVPNLLYVRRDLARRRTATPDPTVQRLADESNGSPEV